MQIWPREPMYCLKQRGSSIGRKNEYAEKTARGRSFLRGAYWMNRSVTLSIL